MKRLLGFILASGVVAMACSVEVADEATSGELVEEAVSCKDPQVTKYQLEASLAVAVANELKRWEPSKDFRVNTSRWDVELTSDGLTQCANNGKPGCPNVTALLELQWNGFGKITNHWPDQFRNLIKTHLERYIQNERNKHFPQVDGVTLEPNKVTSWDCGPMNWFTSSDPDASKLFYKMIAYGGATYPGGYVENPFLNFTTAGNEVGIDPIGEVVGGGTTAPAAGSCETTSNGAKYQCNSPSVGFCCFNTTNAKSGVWAKSTWNPCMLLCQVR